MRVYLLVLLLTTSATAKAQTFKDVFNENTEITWLGLDYSMVKIVGDELNWNEADPYKMFKSWNQLMEIEQDKYNMAKALHRDKVKFALEVTMAHNKLVNTDSAFVYSLPDAYALKLTDLNTIVQSYDFLGNSGIGVMFIVESLNKDKLTESLCVTFINMNTKEILFTTRMKGKPGGFGLRNFWASPIDLTMSRIQTSYYKMWKKKALKSS